jgi:hypothetical protein
MIENRGQMTEDRGPAVALRAMARQAEDGEKKAEDKKAEGKDHSA